MTNFARGTLAMGGVIVTLLGGIVVYAGRTLPAMMSGSKAAIERFFLASQRHQNAVAQATLTSDFRAKFDAAKLQKLWSDFESKNGPVKRWYPADAQVRSGGRANLWPRYVDYIYRVEGAHGNRVFYARVVPDGAGWKINELRLMNQ